MSILCFGRYLNRTERLREHHTKLFLAVVKPYKPVSKVSMPDGQNPSSRKLELTSSMVLTRSEVHPLQQHLCKECPWQIL